jgi:hypothetical protein
MPTDNVQAIPGSVRLTIIINVSRTPTPVQQKFNISMNVIPATPLFVTTTVSQSFSLRINPIPMRIKDSVSTIMKELLAGKVNSFYDEDRELKTLLNFGQDYQALLTNWIYDPKDSSEQSMLVKTYQPLPDEVQEKMNVWISRELSPTLVEKVFLYFTPDEPDKVYLRPRNTNISVTNRTGLAVNDLTMAKLLSSKSFDIIRPSDPVLEEWFTDDINTSELNIDYDDYRNFVFFGSAKARLDAFVTKLSILENIEGIIQKHSASLTQSDLYITSSVPYPVVKKLADQRLDIVRSFDPYERFLYYKTEIPYSASLSTNDEQDAIYYNVDATWPKISGNVAPVASASTWYHTQANIAAAYDKQNLNALHNNVPLYLQYDVDSTEFLTFVKLIGHQYDTIKTYIDHMSDIYDRSSDPTTGMSQDLVWNVAQSFGVILPNQYAIKNLVDYTIGSGSATPKIYREVAAETWKRILHNQVYMMKSKGTKNSLRALANAYGILPSILQIRESTTPGPIYTGNIFETYEENTNALTFSSSQSVNIPWSGSNIASTLQIRFCPTQPSRSVLLNTSNYWALTTEKLSTTKGLVSFTAVVVAWHQAPFRLCIMESFLQPWYRKYRVVVRSR